MNAPDLRAFPLLKELDDDGLETLSEWLEQSQFPAGSTIFEEGDPADALLLIASGTVRLEGSRCRGAARVKSGSALGGASLCSDGPRETGATAESDCELLLLSETAFRMLEEEAPRVACRLLAAIARELASSARQTLDTLAEHARAQA